MAKRRTKAQMEQARYENEVDQYRYFVLFEGDILTGYHYEEDCEDVTSDAEGMKVVTKRTGSGKYKAQIEAKQLAWKLM
jgi:hypothetical protein|tara:strand:+ start:787 stop:1023 length:237 start_codon:yes stop_codon:yes gene_type:complete